MKRSEAERKRRVELAAEADRLDEAYGRVGVAIAAAPPKDLSRNDLIVLGHIAEGEGATLGWLAEHLGLPKSTTSVLVKRLERERFVRRRRHASDERRLEITLTPKGRRRVLAARALDAKALAAALQTMKRQDRATLVDAMERLADAAAASA